MPVKILESGSVLPSEQDNQDFAVGLVCVFVVQRGDRTTRRPNGTALGRTTPSAVHAPGPAQSPRSREELEGPGQLGGGSGNGSNHGTVRRLESTWQGSEPRPSCRSTPGAAYISDVPLWPLPTDPTGQPTCLLGVRVPQEARVQRWPATEVRPRGLQGPARDRVRHQSPQETSSRGHQVQTRGPLRSDGPRCRHQRVVVTYWSDDNSNTRTRRPQVGLTVSRTGCIPSLVMIRSEASLPT